MKVILNSDITYHDQLVVDGVSKGLESLCYVCAQRGHTIVIPTTTLLEFTKQQSERLQETISRLENAYSQLDRFAIPHSRVEPSKVVKEPDLVGLLKRLGADVIIEDPTFADFREAHRRACLHESPHPPKTKGDEMRDLVIWMIALRIASQEGGALLISRDEVHTHPRGDDEALKVRLTRVKSVDEALEFFDVETPSGTLIQQLLQPVWIDLLDSGLPLTNQMSVLGISGARFVQGDWGPSLASCTLKARTADGKVLKAITEIHATKGIITQVILSDISIDGERLEEKRVILTPNKVASIEDDFNERLGTLRAVLEE